MEIVESSTGGEVMELEPEKAELVKNFLINTFSNSNKCVIVAVDLESNNGTLVYARDLCKSCIRQVLVTRVEEAFEKDPSFVDDCSTPEGSVKSPYPNI